jgi:hypothetical protein
MSKRKYPDEIERQICGLYSSGQFGLADLSKAYGFGGPAAVLFLLRRHGVKRFKQGLPVGPKRRRTA